MKSHQPLAAMLAIASLAVGACATDGGSASNNGAPSKAGGRAAPITITIADSQAQGRPSNLPLNEFSSQIATLSNGSMEVKVVYTASADAPIPGSDAPIIDKLRAGGFQMAVVPARAWTTAGASSMQALQAPFLVQSDEQMTAIVHDRSLVSSMLAGLDDIGVHGLTIFPESLRHFFSFTSPILKPADVKARQIRYVSSPDVAALITTLGATAVDPSFDDFAAGVQDGSITAADSGFATGLKTNPRPATATGNLVLYPKMITLVANAAFWNGLSRAQQTTLTTAAQKTQDWAIANRVGEREAAANYCAGGGTIVLTEPQALADFRVAAAPIYAELEKDQRTKRTIEAIDSLASDNRGAGVQACAPGTTVPTIPAEVAARGGDLPNGVYRVEVTDEFLRSMGQNVNDVHEDHGVFTYRMQDGHMTWDQAAENVSGPVHGDAVYQVDGNKMAFKWGANMGGAILQFTWTVDGDGALHFTQTDYTTDANWLFKLPWPRVGDL
jgi:TRAP-type C4-dicarboxylate transport system substrate-binding protein